MHTPTPEQFQTVIAMLDGIAGITHAHAEEGTTMHMPTQEQFQTVIDTLKSVLPMAQHEGHLDMNVGRVQDVSYTCGTVHCVAGWYTIGAGILDEGKYYSFVTGADRMAQTLGFKQYEDLEQWAYIHPAIWGNEYGRAMFCMPIAWNGAKTLADCVKHLEGVRDRV